MSARTGANASATKSVNETVDEPRVFVLGAGRAGMALVRGLREGGVAVVGFHGRHASTSDGVTAGTLPPELGGATVALVAVRDAQLEAALEELAPALPHDAVVLHLSGATEPRALTALREAGHACGTFHPLVPLAAGSDVSALLRGAWIGIDGDALAIRMADRLAAALGARVLRIPPGEKARYHAAAVLASNYPVVLAVLAERLMCDAGVERGAARGAVATLLAGAVSNLRRVPDAAPLASALTGPIVRGDHETVRRHLEALAADPLMAAVYRSLAEATAALLAREGSDVVGR